MATLGHRNSHPVYFHMSDKPSIQTVNKDLGNWRLPGGLK